MRQSRAQWPAYSTNDPVSRLGSRVKISVVSPVYDSAQTLSELLNSILEHSADVADALEVIFVDDGSTDESWQTIRSLAEKHKNVKGIKLSRNFGQHAALTAGFEACTGDVVVVLDCDLQHDPRFIPDLVNKHCEGYDVVLARTDKRRHPSFKNATARMFHRLFNFLLIDPQLRSEPNVTTFSLLSRKALDAVLSHREYHRHHLGLARLVGFPQAIITVEQNYRKLGASGYSTVKLVLHALDALSSYSTQLLQLVVLTGAVISVFSFLGAIAVIVGYFTIGFQSGWPSLITAISFFFGVMIASIGVLGLYIGKIFEQVKGRPLYIIEDMLGGEATLGDDCSTPE